MGWTCGTFEEEDVQKDGIWWGDFNRRNLAEYLGIYLRMLLQCDIRKGRLWTGLISLRAGQVAGCCEQDNEISICIKCERFLDSRKAIGF